MSLSEDLVRIAAQAERFAGHEEELTGVLAAEPATGERVYLCSYEAGPEQRSWLALDQAGRPVEERSRVRDTVSILALCELAEETAGRDLPHPRLASPAHLDEIGSAVGTGADRFALAMKASSATVDELAADIEANYKLDLD